VDISDRSRRGDRFAEAGDYLRILALTQENKLENSRI